MNNVFYNNFFSFILDLFVSHIVICILVVIIIAIVAWVVPLINSNTSDKHAFKISIVLFLSILLSLSLLIFIIFHLDIDNTQGMTDFKKEMLSVDFKNKEFNRMALDAYNAYILDNKVKLWESISFENGLEILELKDVGYQLKNDAKFQQVKPKLKNNF